MSSRAYRSAGLARSLALLRWFLVATAAILPIAAVVLTQMLEKSLRDEALAVNADHVAVHTSSVLLLILVTRNRVVVGERDLARLRALARARGDVTGISIWSSKKRLLTSTFARSRSARAPDEVAQVLAGRGPRAALTDLATQRGGSQASRRSIVARP